MAFQKTLKSAVTLVGVGLHSGLPVRMRILPSSPDTGVRFRRVDVQPAVEIAASSRNVSETTLATVLASKGAEVSTVEHCLAALSGLEVDNAIVEVDGPELPIMDGSALPYVQSILRAGLRKQSAPRRWIRVDKPVRVEDGDKFSILRPSHRFSVTYSIDFSGRLPGTQHFYVEVTPDAFAVEISPARTFGFLDEVEYLRSAGKAKGGNLDNAVVIHGGKVLNPEGFRIPDECVRHKILDAVGDLALAGMPILGHLIVNRGGHALHDRLVKTLLARPDSWSVVEAESRQPSRPTDQPQSVFASAHA